MHKWTYFSFLGQVNSKILKAYFFSLDIFIFYIAISQITLNHRISCLTVLQRSGVQLKRFCVTSAAPNAQKGTKGGAEHIFLNFTRQFASKRIVRKHRYICNHPQFLKHTLS